MTKTPDADILVQSSTTPDNQITKTSSSASSLNIPSTEGIASAAGKLNVIAELAGNEKLAKKAAKVQKVASQAKQGIEIAQNVLHRVQTWGQKNKVPEGVPNAAEASSGLSQLLGLSPSGLQFTLQSAGLPPTTFEVIRFNFYEHYNALFALDVEVASADAAIAFNAVLDNQATLTLWRDGKQLRQVKGIVAHFEQGDSGFHQTFYRLHIVPDMWRLGLRANSRIFQQKDIQSILTTLLSDNKVMDYRFVLRDSHPAREFCVQYRETDLDFFNRLTAEEGIFYYFDENSVLVLSDDAASLNNEKAVVLPYNLNHNAQLQEDTVNAFAHNERVRVSHAVLKDYTFKKPLWETMFHAEAKDVEAQRATYEHYDFPGRFKDGRGKQYTQYRLDSLRNDAHSGRGKSNSPCLMAGGLLQLQQHPNAQFNTLWQLTGVTYEGEQPQAAKQDAGGGATTLHCVFTCIPRHQTWRPLQRTKPLVEGPQPAIVTGPKGEEIYTDNFGRVRLQFLWDREGKYDDHSSCWVRVTQPWAGKGWGMVAIPRVGHEVMVDFLEGDPDQPIVTGRTYHANMPLPAKLPQHKTQMHLMSQTYKGGGYNGMMMEDEQGKQRLDFQAQRDMNTLVINDRATNVGGNHKETVKGEQKISVGQARYKEVVGEETQTIDEAQIITVGKDYQLIANNGPVSMTSKADNVIFETAGARLTLFKNGNIQLEGKSVCINGAPIELNPGGAAASSAETDSAPASDAGGDGGAGGGGGGDGGAGGGGGGAGGGPGGGAEGDSSSNSLSGAFSTAGIFASKLAESKVTDAVAGKIANDLMNLAKNTTDLFMDRGLVAAGINGSNHVMREAPNALKSAIRSGAKHAPGIVGAALDFGTQIAQGENVTNATVKVAGHMGAGAIGAAIGTAIPIPILGTAIGFGIGTGLGMLFDSAYDSYFK